MQLAGKGSQSDVETALHGITQQRTDSEADEDLDERVDIVQEAGRVSRSKLIDQRPEEDHKPWGGCECEMNQHVNTIYYIHRLGV